MPTLKRETGVQLGHRSVQISCLIQQCRGGREDLEGGRKAEKERRGVLFGQTVKQRERW